MRRKVEWERWVEGNRMNEREGGRKESQGGERRGEVW